MSRKITSFQIGFLLLILLFFIPNSLIVHAFSEDYLQFERISMSESPVIARPTLYDQGPSAFTEDGGSTTRVWYCGNDYDPQDHIVHAAIDSDNQIVPGSEPRTVLDPMDNDTAQDGIFACSPTVFKHSNPNIEEGKSLYKMYYECAARHYSNDCPSGDSACENHYTTYFTQICHAVSDDGLVWKRWREENDIWSYSVDNEPTPVIRINDLTVSNCDYQFDSIKNRHTVRTHNNGDDCTNMEDNYGVGHPTAVVLPKGEDGEQQVYMWYYDSQGDVSQVRVFLVKSWDGFHFDPPVETNTIALGDVKYLDIKVGDHQGVFISNSNYGGELRYSYSFDGIDWRWPVHLDNIFNMGRISDDKCMISHGSIVTDPYGVGHSNDISMIVGGGYYGTIDQGELHNCFSSMEDDLARGSTWDLYLMKGTFRSMTSSIIGDINQDGIVNVGDLRKLINVFATNDQPADLNSDGRVDIYDLGILVASYGDS